MGQVLDVVDVGHVDRDLVALLDLEAFEAEGRRGRGHVDPHLAAVPDPPWNTTSSVYPVGLAARAFHRVREERVVAASTHARG